MLAFSQQAKAQQVTRQFATDADLFALVEKHIHTPVSKTVLPNGDVYLQRSFTDYLYAMPVYQNELPAEAQDHGHDHNLQMLEEFLNRPHPSVATLEKYFDEAGKEFGVPVNLLRSYGQVQSNWAQVGESMYGSWGLMGLIEKGEVKQLSQAAGLLGTTMDAIKTDGRTHIRAAAALLTFYQKKRGKAISTEDWFLSVRELTGLTDAAMQTSLAQRAYRVLQEGSKTVSIWGEIIYLQPNEGLRVPEAKDAVDKSASIAQQGNGVADYPGAIYSPTTCNYNSRSAGATIRYYFVHYIAEGTYEGAISWFKNCESRVSAHYVVRNSDGQITQVVDEANRAWSQGVTEYNDQGVGVEHEVIATNLSMWDNPVMLASAGRLAADVCNRNSIPKQRRGVNGDRGIYGHSDVRATLCPNMTQARWDAFLSNVQGALPAVATPTLWSLQAAVGSSAVTASWRANTEPSLLGYRLYYATNDAMTTWALAANEATLTAGTTSVTLQPAQFIVPPAEPVHHFRLSAVVPNGSEPVVESSPSDVYSRSWNGSGAKVLIVDGFDRISGSYKINTHNFATSYFKALRDRGVVLVSTVANERVEDGTINLADYNMVVWFLGDESSADVVFTSLEKQRITNYLNGGGKMLISGSEIAYNIGRSTAAGYDLTFMTNYLKATYVNDGTSANTPATGVIGTVFEGLSVPFGIVYPEDFPDAISPSGGAASVLTYAVLPNIGGIAYTGTFGGNAVPGALIYLGFPLETASDVSINAFIDKAVTYFGVETRPAAPIVYSDVVTAQAGKGKRIAVLANDAGNGGTINAASITISTPPANGIATPNADGTVHYVPNAGFAGTDVFAYKVAGNSGLFSNTAQVSVAVVTADNCSGAPPEVDDNYPLRDLRGAWVTSVYNLDWPSSRTASPAVQQAELLRILDTLRNTGFNTVFLQVRTACDALYTSPYEPWSYYLTGTEGQAPNPLWDPLAFAVQAAHERGLDLHAWVNPYRARAGSYPVAASHVINQRPDWILTVSTNLVLNPGLPEVRTYLTNIMADIATRYDVDGVHFDDYFYPSGITSEDAGTYAAYNPTGIATIQDWRRDNVNRLIALVYDTLKAISIAYNRNVIFGVSPAGIWKSGTPPGITGNSSYSALYCDPIAWLQAGKVDYLAPQLYWKITGAQDYNILSQWWNDQGRDYGRPIYPGLAWYRLADASNWPASEIEEQIKLNRLPLRNEILGEVGYRSGQIMANSKGLKTALQQGLYRYKSYAPPFRWRDSICPNVPQNVRVEGDTLRWDPPAAAADGDLAVKYVVYRYNVLAEQAPLANDGTKVVDIVSKNKLYLSMARYERYVVTALDKNNNESPGASSSEPDVVLCSPGSTTLPALVSGSSYQWQILQGEQWIILDNPSIFGGTNSPVLSITGIMANFYGTKLRCMADGNKTGPEFTLRFGSTWSGSQSTSWGTDANWSCGKAPTIEVDAIIPGGVPVFPLVDAPGAAARRVLLYPNARVDVTPGIQLQVGKE